MNTTEWVKASCASLLAAVMVMQPVPTLAENPKNEVAGEKSVVEIAPRSSAEVARYTRNPETEPVLTHGQKKALLQENIKYVFVLFQENRSFDFHFGTYPGARGLFAQPADQTPGFTQPIVLTNGSVGTISPFLMPTSIVNVNGVTTPLYPEDTDSVNHGHTAIDAKLDLNASNVAQNDRYAFTEEGLTGTLTCGAGSCTYSGPAPTEQQVQKGELVVSHIDCNTVPFLWNYADRFTLFDNFFDTVIGPSTPNALAVLSGQSGVTQWIKHPQLGSNINTTNAQLPVTGDPQPFWGSALDPTPPPRQPTEGGGAPSTNPASNQTYASLALSFMGNQVQSITANDLNPAFDLLDVQADIQKLAGSSYGAVPWAWYQEGYDLEPTDTGGTASHVDYIAHHDAPQYFGYEANNPNETAAHMKGLGDFFTAVNNQTLVPGVYYIRGGYGNLDGLIPRSPSPAVEAAFTGNDDHPGYSDAQISEALLGDEINAIANSPYWPQSAIIITYDETDGLYDHTQPAVRSWDPLGNALSQGPRIPGLVISPYSVVHGISHEATEHGSIIRFIDELFGLIPLGDLPDESAARALGLKNYGQKYLGPSDANKPGVGDMFSGFDNGRLTGQTPPLPASYATIPQSEFALPHFGGQGCRVLGIVPTDYIKGGVIDPAPQDVNPRPSTNPGVPYNGGWPSN